MKNCLVTKLKDIVVNDNLLKLNEFRLSFYKRVYTGNENSKLTNKIKFNMLLTDSIEVHIISGDAYFTETDTDVNKGKSVKLSKGSALFVVKANSEFELSFRNKTNIIGFGNDTLYDSFMTPIPTNYFPSYTTDVNLADLKYLNTDLRHLRFDNINVVGDVSNLNAYTSLKYVILNSIYPEYTLEDKFTNLKSKLYGDGQFLFNSNIERLSIAKTKITADISKANFENMKSLSFWGSKVYGNISNVKFPPLSDLIFASTISDITSEHHSLSEFNIYGDVCKAAMNMDTDDKPIRIYAKGIKTFYGNIAQFPLATSFFTNYNGNSIFTYIKEQATPRRYIIALEDVNLGEYLDDYLIDMSTLEFNPNVVNSIKDNPFYAIFRVKGELTDKSQEARDILISKGVSLVINE